MNLDILGPESQSRTRLSRRHCLALSVLLCRQARLYSAFLAAAPGRSSPVIVPLKVQERETTESDKQKRNNIKKNLRTIRAIQDIQDIWVIRDPCRPGRPSQQQPILMSSPSSLPRNLPPLKLLGSSWWRRHHFCLCFSSFLGHEKICPIRAETYTLLNPRSNNHWCRTKMLDLKEYIEKRETKYKLLISKG